MSDWEAYIPMRTDPFIVARNVAILKAAWDALHDKADDDE